LKVKQNTLLTLNAFVFPKIEKKLRVVPTVGTTARMIWIWLDGWNEDRGLRRRRRKQLDSSSFQGGGEGLRGGSWVILIFTPGK
jgi:hypothetical protein